MSKNPLNLKLESNLRPMLDRQDQERIKDAYEFWDFHEQDEQQLEAYSEHEFGRMGISELREEMAMIFGPDYVEETRIHRKDIFGEERNKRGGSFPFGARRATALAASVIFGILLFCSGAFLSPFSDADDMVLDTDVETPSLRFADNLPLGQPSRLFIPSVDQERSLVGPVNGSALDNAHVELSSTFVSILSSLGENPESRWVPFGRGSNSGFFIARLTAEETSVYDIIFRLLDANAFQAIYDELYDSELVDPQRMPVGDIVFGFLTKVGKNEYEASVGYSAASSGTHIDCGRGMVSISQPNGGLDVDQLISKTLAAMSCEEAVSPRTAGVSIGMPIPLFFPGKSEAELTELIYGSQVSAAVSAAQDATVASLIKYSNLPELGDD